MFNYKKRIFLPFVDDNNKAEGSFSDNTPVMNYNSDSIDNFERTFDKNDELFVNMSHELKTPLNVIFSATQLMELCLTDDSTEIDKQKTLSIVTSVKQNCYRLTKIINNLMDISRINTGNLKLNINNKDIVKVIEDIVHATSSFIAEKKLSIIFSANADKKFIAFDEEKIERVVLNLISNAVKFSNPGGSIHINLNDKGDTVEISVEDNGIGIDEQYLNNIFDRFSQVDKSLSRIAEGSGIGLYIAKAIVELHGGNISIDSKLNQGSIFRFEIPANIYCGLNGADKIIYYDDKIEMIKIEFSDISQLL